MEVLHQTGRWDGEVVHTKADGATIVVESRQVLEKSGTGEPLEFLEINRDVTARVRAQNELLEAHRKTTAILQSISDGFNAFDREWRYTYVNAAGAKMVHKKPGELLGKCFWELWPHAADSSLGVTYRRAMAENVPLQVESFYPEPLNAWFDVRCYPSSDGLSVFFTDITERKLTEERLRQTQTLESIGLLAGGVAHDFNNLLSVIIGSAAMALHERPGCEDLSSILSAAERASALTRQLLAYAGKGRFVFEPIALSELVLRSSALLRASLPRRVNLNFALAENLPSVKGDAGQIRQILTNLVVNAAEAALPDTETVIVIATGTRTITSNTNGSAGFYVWLEVKDNGSGMDTATKPRIFEPFYSTKFTGRGLGLAAVQGIVRSHKGFIEVNSMPGEGTSFKVFLPASAPAAALAEQV
jgi:two-component system, cell cycle sensor histidine kinase and response regulator CckA